MRRLAFLIVIFLSASILAACGSSSGLLLKHQLRTPLQCPCPTIAPLATYPLQGEVAFLPNSYLGTIATGPDGNLWAPELDANLIARVTPGGTITEFPVPTAKAGPYIIAPGPDGAMWFSENNANTIGRISTSGVVTEFPLPSQLATVPAFVQGLATGPDGNIWFVHAGANVIGVMSTAGVLLATYQIPTPNPIDFAAGTGGATFIIDGPDGNMWFTEESGNKIGRITPSGAITEFPIPTAGSTPKNLVVGADGNIWFPEAKAGNIARITMSGAITEIPVVGDPTTVRLVRVATTADGSLWFTEPAIKAPWNSEIGQMNTAGVETNLYSFPNGFPWALATGPDGNPWFTDWNNASINRL